ncbi:histidinol-phosphatase [Corynebacterium diphtheriae]|uniref:histidinol-phosphatase n=1 Tax=Corynebacterium diphtheriae TaxID=1717 RepID=UPI00064C6914|nr:histidinol-phosphatase [Corynebacterium diphtheriae]OWN08126.1 histidinol-phosphatase [Corynebacterium belfantii]APM37060.1 histidinol-phosphatase [Corynebacterium diphtheriae]KLN41236.1 histidinol-phosphatase [Corynebacterium diphtheriae bv. gravis str. ISS 4060]MBG9264546.1 histidinol-phosphatase [Corynebacterium diphtheriae bv. gravis]MBG9303001.1 histidinol-phosphatase [Corynebacterium diphtheriae bv. mitis]
MSYHDDLEFALQLADAADAITLARFAASDLKVSSKPDMTPVSDADIATECELRDLIAQRFPEDAILGEEFGGTAEFTGRQWIIDPIDGTKNYVRGVPVWATLIALLVDGHPVVGVVSAPAIAHRWWAAQGEGAWRSNPAQESRRIHVSNVAQLTDASVSFSSLDGWKERGLLNNFVALSDETWRLRGFGDFFSYCLVAEGAVDIAAEPEVSLWDLAPLSILVEEAGGVFSSFDGTLGPHGGNALATNGLLHDEVRTMLTSSR